MTSRERDAVIVVGVDGSKPSRMALEWAARQAERTGAQLRVVMAWHMPSMAYTGFATPVLPDFEATAREVVEKMAAEVSAAHPDLAVTSTVQEGHPAAVLVEESTGAELLVVGSRGHGAFAGMLIGSVSEHCVSHARCPVVVVRVPPEPEPEPGPGGPGTE